MKKKSKDKIVLEIIEEIACNLGCTTRGRSKVVDELLDGIDDIYCFAHVQAGKCKNKHLDWKKELDKRIARRSEE